VCLVDSVSIVMAMQIFLHECTFFTMFLHTPVEILAE
jgi:hypothetical protein